MSFGPKGTMIGDDTVNSLQAGYRLVASGYEPGQVSVSGNGFAGPVSATVKRTLFGIDSCFASPLPGQSKPPRADRSR